MGFQMKRSGDGRFAHRLTLVGFYHCTHVWFLSKGPRGTTESQNSTAIDP
jgi:hypothetical protein